MAGASRQAPSKPRLLALPTPGPEIRAAASTLPWIQEAAVRSRFGIKSPDPNAGTANYMQLLG